VTVLDTGPALVRLPRARTDVAELVASKHGQRVAVCIPARDEAATVGAIVATAERLRRVALVDELVVVDDGSTDATAAHARAAGASVVASATGPGKGQALTRAVASTTADILVFLDADVTNFSPRFVTALVAPLLTDAGIQLVKAAYRRPLDGAPDEGGRVTELLARPLLRRFFPSLAAASQPLAGECAVRRQLLDDLTLADGYGIEIGLLIDVFRRDGLDGIVEADLGERVHRNRPLRQLRPHADEVLAAVLDRVHPVASNRGARP
jgi:glucosyl-3-phosphoglycerate synthase